MEFLESIDRENDSILDLVYENYRKNISFEKYSSLFRAVESHLRAMDRFQADRVMELVFELCNQHEKDAYIAGIRDGLQLAQELAA